MTRRSPAKEGEYYSRHPHRVLQALRRGELDGDGYLVVSFLIADLDQARLETKAYLFAELEGVLGLRGEPLRRCLHRLKEGAWIDFPTPRRGPRNKWVIRLTGAAIETDSPSDPSTFPPTGVNGEEIDDRRVETRVRVNLDDLWLRANSHIGDGGNSTPDRPDQTEIRSHPSDVTAAASAAPGSLSIDDQGAVAEAGGPPGVLLDRPVSDHAGGSSRDPEGPRQMPEWVTEWFRSHQ